MADGHRAAGDRHGHRARRHRRGAGAPRIAQRLRQDHRNAVSDEPADPPRAPPAAEAAKRRGSTLGAALRALATFFYRRQRRACCAAHARWSRGSGRERAERLARSASCRVDRAADAARTAWRRRSIALAFPEKSEAERTAILRGAGTISPASSSSSCSSRNSPPASTRRSPTEGTITVAGIDQFVALRDDGKPAVIFAAHLANWEMLGVVGARSSA